MTWTLSFTRGRRFSGLVTGKTWRLSSGRCWGGVKTPTGRSWRPNLNRTIWGVRGLEWSRWLGGRWEKSCHQAVRRRQQVYSQPSILSSTHSDPHTPHCPKYFHPSPSLPCSELSCGAPFLLLLLHWQNQYLPPHNDNNNNNTWDFYSAFQDTQRCLTIYERKGGLKKKLSKITVREQLTFDERFRGL